MMCKAVAVWLACVFITAGPSTKLFAWGGGGYWRTCATRDDEPRPVWTSLPITHGFNFFFYVPSGARVLTSS
jgi:hypothetical protein